MNDILINYWKSNIENILPNIQLIHNPFKESTPKEFEYKIGDTGEKALQRAIIDSKVSNIDDTIIKWLDIELPVGQEIKIDITKNSNRIDLIGSNLSKSIYTIVELKYGKCQDSPCKAAAQLLNYFYNILHNKEVLEQNNVHHTNQLDSWK